MARLIYVTEDDESIRELIKMALASFGYEVMLFETAEETLDAVKTCIPDLFLFDIMLPGMDGIAAVKQLRTGAETEATPVLMLTAKDTELDKVTGLDAGADDYLAKPFGIMELGARVRALLRRSRQGEPVLETGGLALNYAAREAYKDGEPVDLTYKEFELLYLLMKQKDRVIPREELLDSVWGIDFAGETRTLDTHIKSLRQKLGDAAEHPRYIKTVRNVGYRFCEVAK